MTAGPTTRTSRTSGSIFSVPGIRGAAVATGVKPSGDPDLALIRTDEPMNAAGVFTRSAAAAAPVHVSRAALARSPRVRTIVINSGNANALTGARGTADAQAMVAAAATHAGGPALVLSTGVIGVPLPLERVLRGISQAARGLDAVRRRDEDVLRAILTTDTREKHAATTTATTPAFMVGGIAKGSGMIHPNMATMLAVVATDAPVAAPHLDHILREAVDRSFHEISVDGDTSTNDAVLLLARQPGEDAGVDGAELESVRHAVTSVCRDLAEQIITDGEGASRVATIEITRAASRDDARAVARAIAGSSLVKTALAGGDPNWGRILAAAGVAGDAFTPETAALTLGDEVVFSRGEVQAFDSAAAERAFRAPHVRIRLDLGKGTSAGRMFTTDLTHDYVEINSAYTT